MNCFRNQSFPSFLPNDKKQFEPSLRKKTFGLARSNTSGRCMDEMWVRQNGLNPAYPIDGNR